jgi:hypothetical protein
VSWLTEPGEDWDEQEAPPRNRLKVAAAVLAGWLGVSLIVLIGLLTFDGRRAGEQRPAGLAGSTTTASAPAQGNSATGSSAPGSSSAPASPSSAPSGQAPAGWVLQATDDQANCTAHSYGQVQVFFARTPCASVHRSLYSTEQDGRGVVVAASTVTFDSASKAADYFRLVTADGTGNVNDLLREGVRYPGSPSKLPPAGFASRQDGLRVLVAEAAFAQGPSDNSDARLREVARQAIAIG